MQLWLKCPVCQAKNSLALKACSACGASLENLPLAKRVYILETAAHPAEAPHRPPPPAAPAAVTVAFPEGAPAAPKKAGPTQPRKKKRQA